MTKKQRSAKTQVVMANKDIKAFWEKLLKNKIAENQMHDSDPWNPKFQRIIRVWNC